MSPMTGKVFPDLEQRGDFSRQSLVSSSKVEVELSIMEEQTGSEKQSSNEKSKELPKTSRIHQCWSALLCGQTILGREKKHLARLVGTIPSTYTGEVIAFIPISHTDKTQHSWGIEWCTPGSLTSILKNSLPFTK